MGVALLLPVLAALALPEGVAGDWTLATLDGQALGGPVRVVIDADGRVTGEGPCNAFDAQLTEDGITRLAVTERQCLWDAGEAGFLGALRAVNDVQRENGALVLIGPAGRMVFQATSPAE